MRHPTLLLLTLVLCPFQGAVAGAWGQLSGKNAAGALVVITDETRSGSPAIIVASKSEQAEFPFKGACSFDLNNTMEPPKAFSCKPDGKSPLAGASYRLQGAVGDCRAMRFRCVRGCNARGAPPVLAYQPWEC